MHDLKSSEKSIKYRVLAQHLHVSEEGLRIALHNSSRDIVVANVGLKLRYSNLYNRHE